MGKGITKKTRGASIKKITPKPDVNKGLCLGTLTNVEVGSAEVKEDSSYIDFRGKSVPRLTFIFTEKAIKKDQEQGMYFHSYMAYPNVFEKSMEWKWDTMAQTIKHFIDVLSEDNFVEAYESLLSFDLEEGKEYSAEEIIAAWKKFFDGVVKVFKGNKKDGLPELIGKDVWMKLLLDFKGKQVDRGNFAMPGYPGDGIIELFKEGETPSLMINIAKGESIIPKEYSAPSASPAPQSTQPQGGGAMPDFMKGN